MCYYNGQRVTYAEYLRLKEIEKELRILKLREQPLLSGFDNLPSTILIANEDKTDADLVEAHWEFLPSHLKSYEEVIEFRKKYSTVNAKAENILTSPLYRESALYRRCLIWSHGFYEWRHLGKIKQPYHVRIKDQKYFYIAGLYNNWLDSESGEVVATYAIVTTKANKLMEQIHNSKLRMPTILPEDLAHEWLMGHIDEERIKELASYQIDTGKMEAYTIDKNFRQSDEPDKPVEQPHIPALEL